MEQKQTWAIVRGTLACLLSLVFAGGAVAGVRAKTDQPDLALVDIVLLFVTAVGLAWIAFSAFALVVAVGPIDRNPRLLRLAAVAKRIAWGFVVAAPVAVVATGVIVGVAHDNRTLIGQSISSSLGPVVVQAVLLIGHGSAIARASVDRTQHS